VVSQNRGSSVLAISRGEVWLATLREMFEE
jgi:hypothetical protein